MRRTPGIHVIAPRIFAGLNGHKAITALGIRQRVPIPRKIRIERRIVLVALVKNIAPPSWPAKFPPAYCAPDARLRRARVRSQ